jgi:large subunit ribosomal protein L9
MQVILLKTFPNLGFVGSLVSVRDGYYRNFLAPRGIAARPTKGSMAQLAHQKTVIEARAIKEKSLAEEVMKRLQTHVVELKHSAGDADKLFGSVTALEIAQALKGSQYEVDKKQITIETSIKTLGEHSVSVKLHPEVTVTVKVIVARKESEIKETNS